MRGGALPPAVLRRPADRAAPRWRHASDGLEDEADSRWHILPPGGEGGDLLGLVYLRGASNADTPGFNARRILLQRRASAPDYSTLSSFRSIEIVIRRQERQPCPYLDGDCPLNLMRSSVQRNIATTINFLRAFILNFSIQPQ